MRRTIGLVLGAVLLLAAPAGVVAAPKSGCPAAASGWFLSSPTAAAADFFVHLIPGQFATADAFAEAIDAGVDKNGDDQICVKLSWGDNLNPNSHWYRLGLELLGEPVHVMTVLDNNANAD